MGLLVDCGRSRYLVGGLMRPVLEGLAIGFGLALILLALPSIMRAVESAGCGDTPRAECMERNIR